MATKTIKVDPASESAEDKQAFGNAIGLIQGLTNRVRRRERPFTISVTTNDAGDLSEVSLKIDEPKPEPAPPAEAAPAAKPSGKKSTAPSESAS